MPTFLSDPPGTVYLLLVGSVIVVGLVWFNRRGRTALVAVAVVTSAMLLLVGFDCAFESPREEAVRRVMAMASAADTRNREEFASHVADTITYQDENRTITLSRDQLRKHAFWDILRNFNVHVATWDFARADVNKVDDRTIEIGFLGKGETEGKQFPVYMRARFSRQSDGQMKLVALASYDPLQRANKRISIPGLSSPP